MPPKTRIDRDIVKAFLVSWMAQLQVDIASLDESQKEVMAFAEDRLAAKEPVALPFRFDGGGGYLCVAPTPSGLRRFREDIDAFIGPTYAIIELGDTALSPQEKAMESLIQLGYGSGFGLMRHPGESAEQLRDQVRAMYEIVAEDPQSDTRAVRSLGHLLRDFTWAVKSEDARLLDTTLSEIYLGGELSEDNQRFLQVQRHIALNDWEAVWADGLISYLLEVPRPQVVTDLLLTAVWHRVLLPEVSNAESVDELVEAFQRSVMPIYGSLFSSAQRASLPMARRMALLYALTSVPCREDVAKAVTTFPTDAAQPDADSLLLRLAALMLPQPPTERPVLELSQEALLNGEFDLAISLAKSVDPVDAVRIMVFAAFELDDSSASAEAVSAFRQLDEPQQQQLLGVAAFRRRLETLDASASALLKVARGLPSSLEDWLDVLESSPDWSGAVECAAAGIDYWSIPKPETVAQTANRLSELFESESDVLLPAIPHLLNFTNRVQNEAGPSVSWPLWQSIFVALILDDNASASDLSVLVDVLNGLLASGPPPDSYADIVDNLRDLWGRRLDSYEHLDWGLEALDVLARNACPDVESRLRFLMSLAGTLRRSDYRLSNTDLAYAGMLFVECQEGDLFAEIGSTRAPLDADDTEDGQENEKLSKWTALAGKAIAIHCLFDPINRRVQSVLRELVGDIELDIDDTSKGCTERLKALCSGAELFVLVTQHCKHAGSDCVERHAKPPTEVLKSGRSRIGSSGVLQVFEDYVDEVERLLKTT